MTASCKCLGGGCWWCTVHAANVSCTLVDCQTHPKKAPQPALASDVASLDARVAKLEEMARATSIRIDGAGHKARDRVARAVVRIRGMDRNCKDCAALDVVLAILEGRE